MDLAAWWRDRKIKALAELIHQLPSQSRTKAAIANDPDFVALMLDYEATHGGGEWSPELTEWDVATELLAEIRDSQFEIMKAVISTIPREKGKPGPKLPKYKPFPRPVTGVEREKKRRSENAQRDIIRQFTPHALDN